MFGGNSAAQSMLWFEWAWMELDPVGEYTEGTAIRHNIIHFLFDSENIALFGHNRI